MSPDTITLRPRCATYTREAAVHKRLARLADLQRTEERIGCKKSVQNPVQLEIPSQD
ncbi:hypothetical protein SBA1_460089 [Candidatus Sulfotelmatobacter kueseliae]|uniref:Uncharacterized protein n=1 Tax=Candidatus Sulfotelmatobacter kueseliae TaxID=2042962 RepID=A0A2U3KS83_9BACT|nr:hypothetical protein SBA1_460089 [Candidatus Sulfotelmatobacter kueseliae]